MTDQLRPDDTRAWLEMLFRPGELFEVRVKANGEHGAKCIWLPYEKIEDFVTTHVPIHMSHKRHLWVGVAPRPRVSDSSPTLHRALWVDFSAAVTSVQQATAAITKANLPAPTMLVWSGNGVHGYWKLREAATPEQVKPFAKALHAALPADVTHDPTRVMRVPGSINHKDPEHPAPTFIAEHHPERVYELTVFPKAEETERVVHGAKPDQMQPLSQEDRELFIANWLDGQKHSMVLGVSGYLRKNLYYDEASAIAEISALHEAAGHEVDPLLVQTVQSTYRQLWHNVAGLRKLEELGIRPAVRDVFRWPFKEPAPKPKPRIEVIDFNETIEDQEFWIDGLVGPGLLTMWAAAPKTGKSFAVMQIGHALATGSPLWGLNVTGEGLKVLYFQGELSKGMVNSRAKSMFGMSVLRDSRRFAMTAKPADPIDLIAHREVLTDLAEGYDVVIVDPLSAFTSNDESKSYAVNEVVGIFDHMRSEGKAVILVHHLRKLDTSRDGTPIPPSFNDIRGSGAWVATADALALHYKLGQEGVTKVDFMFRAAPERDPMLLYRMPHGGFSSDKHAFLAANPAFRVNVASPLN